MKDLERVIKLRSGKVDNASKAEKEHAQALEDAQQDLRDAREKIDAFAHEMRDLEASLIAGVVRHEVSTHDMMMIEQILKKAAERARSLVDDATRIENEITSCRDTLEEARAHRISLSKKLNNIVEMKSELSRKADLANKKTLGRKEQNVMEDAYLGVRGR